MPALAASAPTTRLDRAFTVVLARRGTELTVGANESITDVLQLAGVQVETLCEQGVCGTCVTTWLAGDPEHRDSCLGADERRSQLAICCARSHSDRLTLDL